MVKATETQGEEHEPLHGPLDSSDSSDKTSAASTASAPDSVRGGRDNPGFDGEHTPNWLKTPPPPSKDSSEKVELVALNQQQHQQHHKNGNGNANGNGESKPHQQSAAPKELYVPVNTHRKLLRGEKLYLTRNSNSSRPWRKIVLCGIAWTLIALIFVIAALAATGIILNTPTSSVAGSEHYKTNETHVFPEMTNAVDGDEMTPSVMMVPVETDTPPVPPLAPNDSTSAGDLLGSRALQGSLQITNIQFTDELLDPQSPEFRNLAAHVENELYRAYLPLSVARTRVDKFRPGSVWVEYYVAWHDSDLLVSPEQASAHLTALLEETNGYLGEFLVNRTSLRIQESFPSNAPPSPESSRPMDFWPELPRSSTEEPTTTTTTPTTTAEPSTETSTRTSEDTPRGTPATLMVPSFLLPKTPPQEENGTQEENATQDDISVRPTNYGRAMGVWNTTDNDTTPSQGTLMAVPVSNTTDDMPTWFKEESSTKPTMSAPDTELHGATNRTQDSEILSGGDWITSTEPPNPTASETTGGSTTEAQSSNSESRPPTHLLGFTDFWPIINATAESTSTSTPTPNDNLWAILGIHTNGTTESSNNGTTEGGRTETGENDNSRTTELPGDFSSGTVSTKTPLSSLSPNPAENTTRLDELSTMVPRIADVLDHSNVTNTTDTLHENRPTISTVSNTTVEKEGDNVTDHFLLGFGSGRTKFAQENTSSSDMELTTPSPDFTLSSDDIKLTEELFGLTRVNHTNETSANTTTGVTTETPLSATSTGTSEPPPISEKPTGDTKIPSVWIGNGTASDAMPTNMTERVIGTNTTEFLMKTNEMQEHNATDSANSTAVTSSDSFSAQRTSDESTTSSSSVAGETTTSASTSAPTENIMDTDSANATSSSGSLDNARLLIHNTSSDAANGNDSQSSTTASETEQPEHATTTSTFFLKHLVVANGTAANDSATAGATNSTEGATNATESATNATNATKSGADNATENVMNATEAAINVMTEGTTNATKSATNATEMARVLFEFEERDSVSTTANADDSSTPSPAPTNATSTESNTSTETSTQTTTEDAVHINDIIMGHVFTSDDRKENVTSTSSPETTTTPTMEISATTQMDITLIVGEKAVNTSETPTTVSDEVVYATDNETPAVVIASHGRDVTETENKTSDSNGTNTRDHSPTSSVQENQLNVQFGGFGNNQEEPIANATTTAHSPTGEVDVGSSVHYDSKPTVDEETTTTSTTPRVTEAIATTAHPETASTDGTPAMISSIVQLLSSFGPRTTPPDETSTTVPDTSDEVTTPSDEEVKVDLMDHHSMSGEETLNEDSSKNMPIWVNTTTASPTVTTPPPPPPPTTTVTEEEMTTTTTSSSSVPITGENAISPSGRSLADKRNATTQQERIDAENTSESEVEYNSNLTQSL